MASNVIQVIQNPVTQVVSAILQGPQGNPGGAFNNVVYVDKYVSATIGGGVYHSVTVTAGSNLITIDPAATGFRFTPAMVNTCSVSASGMPNTNGVYPTIDTYISPTQVRVSQNSTTTTNIGRVIVFETNRDDTAGILQAVAVARTINAAVCFNTRPYLYGSTINMDGTQGYFGQGVHASFLVAKRPAASIKGDAIQFWNAPAGIKCKGLYIQGPGTSTPAYVTGVTITGGQLTATVGNGVTMDSNARIQLVGARGSMQFLRWTYFQTTGTPTSSGFTGSALTWDNRPGYASVANISIAANVVTITTSAAHSMETAEQIYLNSLTTATFLNGQRVSVVNTTQGTTTVQATAPSFKTTSVVNNGDGTATYTGTYTTGSLAGVGVTFSGFSNSANNGTFTVTSSTSTTITVSNSSAVNETPSSSASCQLTTYTSHADTGTLAYLPDGTFTDNIAAIHDYVGLRIACHPTQGSTILHQMEIEDNVINGFKGAACKLAQPNYGFVDKLGATGSIGGLWCESAYPTTGRFTNPSAFHIRGGSQLYGSLYGLAIVNCGGMSVDIPGCNGSGVGIMLDNPSGLSLNGWDCETETPVSGMTDLFPGYCIELRGGKGVTMRGGFSLVGNPSNTAAQTMFYAWNGATDFSYEDVAHIGSSGYTQPTSEILVDASCSNYSIKRVQTIAGNMNNVSLAGTGYNYDIAGTVGYVLPNTGGLSLFEQTAATSGANKNGPVFFLGDNYHDGVQSQVGGFQFQSVPAATGSNPIETLSIKHIGSSGGSIFSWNGGGFTIGGSGNTSLIQTIAATSGANQSSPTFAVTGKLWHSGASVSDTYTWQNIIGTGTDPTTTLTLSHTAGGSGLSTVSFGGSAISMAGGTIAINTSGNFTAISGITTAPGAGQTSAGVPIIQRAPATSGLTANVAATTIVGTSTQIGLYRVTVFLNVATPATTSSTLPDCRIIYTDRDTGAVVTIPVTAGNTGNSTSTATYGTILIDTASATNIQYDIGQITPYASSGATAMVYNFRARLEYLG